MLIAQDEVEILQIKIYRFVLVLVIHTFEFVVQGSDRLDNQMNNVNLDTLDQKCLTKLSDALLGAFLHLQGSLQHMISVGQFCRTVTSVS